MSTLPQSNFTLSSSSTLTLEMTSAIDETTPLTLTPSATLSTTWVKGVTLGDDGMAISGYYDVNKTWTNDTLLCWAASSSNMIAWWQNYYDTTDYAAVAPPEDVEDIFNVYKANWVDEGNAQSYACNWWLTGRTFDGYIGDGTDGGYYSNIYSTSSSTPIGYEELMDVSATRAGDAFVDIMESGGIVSLNIFIYDGTTLSGGHAVTLWGLSRDADTGHLTSLYLTDSDDNKDGIITATVSYNATKGCYDFTDERFTGYSLVGYASLGAFDKTGTSLPPVRPSELAVSVQEKQAVFTWKGDADASYEIRLVGPGEKEYTYKVSAGQFSFEVTLPEEGFYKWSIRATNNLGNSSSWVSGNTFSNDKSLPQPTMETPVLSRLAEGSSQVSLSWNCNETATYELKINDNVVYTGSEKTYVGTLEDGTYTYTLTVTDESGNVNSLSGTFTCDATAPTQPSELRALSQGKLVTFSWQGGVDANEVTYELRYRRVGESEYNYRTQTDRNCILNMPAEGEYEWGIRATDSAGNSSAWVSGTNFSYDESVPEVTLNAPSQWSLGNGKTHVSFSWMCSESATYTLEVNGRVLYKGTDVSASFSLLDGSYTYTVTATDTVGNSGSASGSFMCDSVVPMPPSELTVQHQGVLAVFTWQKVEDANGVSYELEYRSVGDEEYIRQTSTNERFSVVLPKEGMYEWRLRAKDGAGNVSTWAQGENFLYDSSIPRVTLGAPTQTKAGSKKVLVTFRWSSNKAATYTLKVDGKSYDVGNDTSYSLVLGRGVHQYTVIATDALGRSGTANGSVASDMAAPVLSLDQVSILKVSTGHSKVSLSWDSNEAATYTVKVGKEVVYSGSDTECRFDYKDGKYNYTITALDATGYKSTLKGKLVVDSTPPRITFREPRYKELGDGLVQASLSWKGESKATYTLLVDGVQKYSGTKASCKLTLSSGSHSYTLIARDAAGNSSETPELLAAAPTWTKVAERQVSVTFNWQGEEGCSYLLKVGGKKYVVAGSSYTLTLKDGKYKYSLSATDASGNSMMQAGSFVCDATSPKLTLSKPKVGKVENGQAAVQFKWSGEKGTTCVLTVDGRDYSVAGKSYTLYLDHGTHEYSLTATDAAGNSTTKAGSVAVDTLDRQLAMSTGCYALPTVASYASPTSLAQLGLVSKTGQGMLAGLA